jgi:hypothetical protein
VFSISFRNAKKILKTSQDRISCLMLGGTAMTIQMTQQEEQAALDWVLREWHDVTPVSTDRGFNDFAGEIHDVVNKLNTLIRENRADSDIVGLVGHEKRSLLKILEMIAYDMQSGTAHATRLGQYKGIKRLSLLGIRTLPPGVPLPEQVLSIACRQAAKESYVLALDYMEVLGENHPVSNLLQGEITRPQGALVIGLYEEKPGRSHAEAALEHLTNIQWSHAKNFTKLQSLHYIEDNYAEDWRAQGYTISKHAFDDVYDLFRGMWIGRQHATLPELFVQLADNSIFFLQQARRANGGADVLEAIDEALEECSRLTTEEWSKTNDAKADQPLLKMLGKVKDVLEEFKRDRTLAGDPFVIERKHILTVLLSDKSQCSFHFPGNEPN